jgi:3-oxoacyl-[acyl-carrier protein] reductase
VTVAIVGGDAGVATSLAAQLIARGTTTVTITDSASTTDESMNLSCDPASAADVRACLVGAESILGESPAVIRLGIRSAQSVATDLASLSLAEWITRSEVPLRETFAFHQAAQRFLADRGGRILVVIPTVGLSGGPGFVPLSTTAEADRSLVKAQARVNGALGITVNCVAVDSALLLGSRADPDRGGLPKHALPTPDLGQVADVIVGLLSSAFAGITGQTIAIDGGRWMAP